MIKPNETNHFSDDSSDSLFYESLSFCAICIQFKFIFLAEKLAKCFRRNR